MIFSESMRSIINHVQKLDNNYNFGLSQPTDGEEQFPEFQTLARNMTLLANMYYKEMFVSTDNILRDGAVHTISSTRTRTRNFNISTNTQFSFELLTLIKLKRESS